MSSVVLDNSASSGAPNSSVLTANGARIGVGGINTTGGITAGGSAGNGSTFYGAMTVADPLPAAPAIGQPTSWTTWASQVGGGGLNPNQLQKYAYCAPQVSPATVQQYENGRYVATATAFVAPAVAVDATFVNTAIAGRPLNFTAPFVGSFTCAAAPVVVPCAGISAGAYVRIFLLGGSAAAFTAAAAGGAAVPAITIQVGATTAAGTFTVTGGETGMIYGYEVLLG